MNIPHHSVSELFGLLKDTRGNLRGVREYETATTSYLRGAVFCLSAKDQSVTRKYAENNRGRAGR